MQYSIEAVFWDDHYFVDRQPLPKSPDELLGVPTLSVGIVVEETKKSLLLASSIEPPQGDHHEVTYLVILKAAIVGRKKYGKIKLRSLK